MMSLLTTTLVAATILSAQAEPRVVVAKHNGEGIEVRWFPPAPAERGERWAYRVERIDSTGTTLPITHMPLQITLNVATLRDRLGSFAETFLGTVASGSTAKRVNENTFNEALSSPVSRALLLRFAVLYPPVADVLGWRRVDQDLQPGKTYTYRVIAIDRAAGDAEHVLGEARALAGTSGVSSPKGIKVTQPAPDRLEVSWSRDLAKEQSEAVLRYTVYRRDDGGPWVALNPGLTAPIQPAPSSLATYVDTEVLAGRSYQYAVVAVDLTGRASSKASSSTLRVGDQRPPLPPLDVELSGLGNELTLTWLVAGLPADLKEIEILKVRRPRAEGGPREVVKVLGRVGPKVGTYRIRRPGLGHHEYALRSVDTSGNRGPLSVAVGVHVDRAVRLKTPGGVRVKLNKENQVEISWKTTPGTDAITYVVERTTAGAFTAPTRISPATLGVRDKLYVDTSPPLDGPPLAYRVLAVDGASARSAPSAWASLPDQRRAPAVSLGAVTRSNRGVHLNWQAADSEVATGFKVQVQVGGGRWSNLPGPMLAASAREAIDATSRPAEASVHYRIQSLGGASGAPILSNVVALRSPARSLSAPTGLSARCVKGGVELRWTQSQGASSYEVQRGFGTDAFVPRGHATATKWVDQAVVHARRYRYRLMARHRLAMSALGPPVEIICSAR
ncbi:MAG: fibronectin type III domain-containing protein [Myxococcota bacterium]